MEIRISDFTVDEVHVRKVRFDVFVKEQKVPAEMEMDDRDEHCIHLLAFDDQQPVGTGRIDLENGGRIGRVAVLKSYRNRHVGTALMTELHKIAKENGLNKVWCHGQISAAPFYERLGYKTVGDHFFEAGIEHVKMVRDVI